MILGDNDSVPLLDVVNLKVDLGRGPHRRRILDDVNLEVRRGEIIGVIGETGSGKTTLARTIVGLAQPESGEIRVEGRTISNLHGRAQRDFRRRGAIQYVFQDPLRSLDPALSVRRIVEEGLLAQRLPRNEMADRISVALTRVGLDDSVLARRPGELSGGQRQRVAIARSVVLEPQILICDEPVSALDASNRNKVLRLLDQLRTEAGVTVVVIAHDLSSLAGIADRVVVLYRGQLVEDGPSNEVFSRPKHPYTALLVASAPAWSQGNAHARRHQLLADEQPAFASECSFAPRCRFATASCQPRPPFNEVEPSWHVACWHHDSWPTESLPHSAELHASTTERLIR
jgi:oligopeptide/dipeptide ABC transporter ATP-binding protein